MRVFLALTLAACAVAVPIAFAYWHPPRASDRYDVVRACAPPVLKASREFILRDPATGLVYHQDNVGKLRPLAPGIDPARACA